MAIKGQFQIGREWLLDLLFPRFCIGCRKEGSSFCPECRGKLDVVWTGKRHVEDIGEIISMGLYREKLWQDLIQQFKYKYIQEMEAAINSVVERFIQIYPEVLERQYDLVVPVPLHKRRQLERGFNQAELFAQIISNKTGWPMDSSNLVRIIKTPPQAQLSDRERQENVRKAFSLKNLTSFNNKKILLVDDVLTTGSTLKEAARTIKAAQAKQIGAWVMARRS
jgi:ComF family protein